MWEWILQELTKQVNKICHGYIDEITDKEDIIAEVCEKLVAKPELAEQIYNEKKTRYLAALLVTQLYEHSSKKQFDNKIDYVRYGKIKEICEKYDIQIIPQNAYKISALLNNKELSITAIETVIKNKKPKMVRVQLQGIN